MFMLSYSPMGKFYNNSFIWGGGGDWDVIMAWAEAGFIWKSNLAVVHGAKPPGGYTIWSGT